MEQSLYVRLGESEGITRIARDLVALHMDNPVIGVRFTGKDQEALVQGAASFFIAGTGGPDVYKGKSMPDTHRGMNISEAELVAALDDALEALSRNNVGQREQEEVLFVLYSMRKEVMKQ